MVNVGLNWASFLGIALALGGAGLYALRTVRPALARDQDIIFAAIALLCGGVLFFQGWRLDPILQFAQTLSVASSIWFAYEAVRLRGIATEQAKRNTPVVDDERPVSRVYRAELDDYPPLDQRDRSPVNRRIRGTREDIRARDDIAEDSRRTRRNPERPSLSDRSSLSDRPRRPRSTRSAELSAERSEQSWNDDSLGERPARSNSVRPSDDAPARSRRSRPTDASRRRSSEYTSSDYVDYQPVDYSDDWS